MHKNENISFSNPDAWVRSSRSCRADSRDTNGRRVKPERLDTAEAGAAERNLRDIARINRCFGGHRTLIQLLRQVAEPVEQFSILDVGAGSGDMGRCIQKRFRRATVISLDRRPFHVRTANTLRIAADAFALPFADRSFDFVMSSSLLHHFSNSEVTLLLLEMRRVALREVIILDLERHRFPGFFLRLTRHLLRWSEITVHDGRVSVEAAFKRSELQSIVSALAPTDVVTRRHWPWFRVSAVFAAQDFAHRHEPARCESKTEAAMPTSESYAPEVQRRLRGKL